MISYQELELPGYTFAHDYDRVDSTMTIARSSIGILTPTSGGCGVVTAKVQTAGRGRQGRQWSSPAGSLMATFIFQVPAPAVSLSGYSLAVGVSIARALEALDAPVKLKWPNDLMIRSQGELKKAGGILMEVLDEPTGRVLLIGLGLNLHSAPDDLDRAISLQEAFGVRVTREAALPAIAAELRNGHDLFFSNGGFAPFREAWNARACFSDGQLTIDTGNSTVAGRYKGVGESGALILEVDGTDREIYAGHVLSWPKR